MKVGDHIIVIHNREVKQGKIISIDGSYTDYGIGPLSFRQERVHLRPAARQAIINVSVNEVFTTRESAEQSLSKLLEWDKQEMSLDSYDD